MLFFHVLFVILMAISFGLKLYTHDNSWELPFWGCLICANIWGAAKAACRRLEEREVA